MAVRPVHRGRRLLPFAKAACTSRQPALRWTVDAFAALRDALGPEIEICVDFHQRTTPAYAIQLANALAPMRPFFIEDPVRAENPDQFAYLRQHISVPIATGEQLASKWDWRALIERDLMDYCRVDLCICGGLTEARKVAGWCETHYIEQAPHNPLGPVSTAACLHFDLSTPLFAVQELTWRPSVLDGVVRTDMRLEGGNLYSGGSPGLGVELDEEAAGGLPVPAARAADLAPRGQLGVGLVAPPQSQRTGSTGGLRNTRPRGASACPSAAAGSSRRPGRGSRACSAARVSARAGGAPMQKCGPCAKARCRPASGRPATNRSGSANTAGSRLAPDSETVTRSPAWTFAPPISMSAVA